MTVDHSRGGFALSVSMAVAVIILALVALASRYTRSRSWPTGRQVRAEWGQPLTHWRDFESIASYSEWQARDEASSGILDDRTWDDLNLDLVFAEIDRTRSTVGRQVLYHRLRRPHSSDELSRFERLVQHYSANETERVRTQVLLSRISHSEGYRLWRLCGEDRIDHRWWYALFPLLAFAAVVSIVAAFFWPRALLLLLGVVIVNIVLRVKLHWRVHHVLGPFRQIGPLLKCAQYVSDSSASRHLGVDTTGYLQAVDSLRSTANWASREVGAENELVASTWEYVNVLFLVDANATLLARRTLQKSGDALLKVIEFVGEVDAAISTASWRAGTPTWSVPQFVDPGGPTVLRDVSHPLIEKAVVNSVVLSPGRGLIVTGSNMSGKSTFLRTVGLTAILAQTLHTCLASSYSGPRLTVRSAIGRSDDLSAGKSYYMVEVEAVLDLLNRSKASDPHLFLFDELFRGTNTIERLAAGEAVLKTLPTDAHGEARHIVIAATHDIELVEMLDGAYDPYHFEGSVQPGGLAFDYVVRPGPARTRNAIALLEISGAPHEVVAAARARVDALDSVRGLDDAR